LYRSYGAANMYFLAIGCLQLDVFFPGLSPTHWSTTIGPLVVVGVAGGGAHYTPSPVDTCHRHPPPHPHRRRPLPQSIDSMQL
jgi:hypothetical protein